jgi:hypothetical protein
MLMSHSKNFISFMSVGQLVTFYLVLGMLRGHSMSQPITSI